ncbi:hypothetical protein NE237_007965 [Protea cynaroides]|uniref:PPIase cyclophilin-type domain-containing protein n=1 Tax=Protea cynaroides TaxID=273540 RepID=A0A9Q0KR16_9MAGN|nr:hypothetical protein NE237_007965 [Protea cynaroides]
MEKLEAAKKKTMNIERFLLNSVRHRTSKRNRLCDLLDPIVALFPQEKSVLGVTFFCCPLQWTIVLNTIISFGLRDWREKRSCTQFLRFDLITLEFWEIKGSVTVGYPYLDNKKVKKALKSKRLMGNKECQCSDPTPRCLLPLPQGYKIPVTWLMSRDMIWCDNVPPPKLFEYKEQDQLQKCLGTLPQSAIQNIIRYLSRQVALASREANMQPAGANTLPRCDEYAHEHILLSRVPEMGMNNRPVVYNKGKLFNHGSNFLKSSSREMKKGGSMIFFCLGRTSIVLSNQGGAGLLLENHFQGACGNQIVVYMSPCPELGVDHNGNEFVIITRNSPESLDASSLIVGKIVDGMDVVERIASVKTEQENTSAPYLTVATLVVEIWGEWEYFPGIRRCCMHLSIGSSTSLLIASTSTLSSTTTSSEP